MSITAYLVEEKNGATIHLSTSAVRTYYGSILARKDKQRQTELPDEITRHRQVKAIPVNADAYGPLAKTLRNEISMRIATSAFQSTGNAVTVRLSERIDEKPAAHVTPSHSRRSSISDYDTGDADGGWSRPMGGPFSADGGWHFV